MQFRSVFIAVLIAFGRWARWVVFLTLGGFAGNFVLSLTDHAMNGFYRETEWIPVIASAIACGFLVMLLFERVTKWYLLVCAAVLVLQAGVGVAGFLLHTEANLKGPSTSAFENFITGAPPLAPLLFPNLSLLGFIGLWSMWQHLSEQPVRFRSRTIPVGM